MNSLDNLSSQQIMALLKLAGIERPGQAVMTKPFNHVWEPFFAGYGGVPDFELFRLRMLGWHATNFTAHGAQRWPATREQSLRRFLAGRDWTELFTN